MPSGPPQGEMPPNPGDFHKIGTEGVHHLTRLNLFFTRLRRLFGLRRRLRAWSSRSSHCHTKGRQNIGDLVSITKLTAWLGSKHKSECFQAPGRQTYQKRALARSFLRYCNFNLVDKVQIP